MRTWTSPDLSDPEYTALLSVFPPFITRKALPRFPVPPTSKRLVDLEEAGEVEGETNHIRVGTGTMWIAPKSRSPGWRGGWWTRFKLWLRSVFC